MMIDQKVRTIYTNKLYRNQKPTKCSGNSNMNKILTKQTN